MIEALQPYAVTVAAGITTTAAIGTYRRAGTILDKIEENAERSRENRRWLIGEPDVLDGPIVPRVRSIEDQIDVDERSDSA